MFEPTGDDRFAALNDLIYIGEPAVEPLIDALEDKDGEVRMWAAEALEQIGSPKALKAVEEYQK